MMAKRIMKAMLAGLALSLLMALAARADSAANQHVSVSCAAPGVSVTVEGNRFDIFAPGYPESFAADVMVVAVNGWVLIKPKASALPLRMKGGNTAGYEVERDPEDEASGTIAFHNYHIKSNHDGGAKDIVVPAGASVTYTAYRNGAARKSDWSVNGQVRNDTSNIIFNRNWWNVPAWFIPSMDTPVAGAYGITAKDVDTPVLTDSGSMKVVGVRRISGPKGKESDRIDPPSGGTTWQEGEVIYAQPCAESEFLPDCTKVSNPAERIVDYDVEAAVQKLRFAPNNSIWGWDWSAPVAFGMKGTVVTAASPFRAAPEVGYESAYELAWEVGFGEAGTADGDLTWKRSSSEHELYLTYNAEVPSFETVFHLSCTSANGKKTDTSVVDGVWSGFTGRNVKRKDGTELTYYNSYLTLNYELEDLLKDADGQCGAWVRFFRKTLEIHGITSDHVWFSPVTADGLLVKTWSFSETGTSMNPDYPYKNDLPLMGDYIGVTQYNWGTVAEVTYTSGTQGQNNQKPASHFNNHQIVYVHTTGVCYDPSYGLKQTNRQSIDNTLSGFWINAGSSIFATDNPPGIQISLWTFDFTTPNPTPIPIPLP